MKEDLLVLSERSKQETLFHSYVRFDSIDCSIVEANMKLRGDAPGMYRKGFSSWLFLGAFPLLQLFLVWFSG
jgi:hypothetical protein